MAGVHRHAGRDALVRTVAPGVGLLVLLVLVGLLLVPPGIAVPTGEEALNRSLEAARTDAGDVVTLAWSLLGSTGLVVGVGVLVSALILGRTGSWRLAAVPVVATVLQQAVFLVAANVVDRPRPPVSHLDEAPPTASYPSGHVGASTALYVSFALLALPLRTVWVRWLAVAVCLAVPVLVAFGRLYRGMHHLTDVGAGFVNGLVCALLAQWWYRGDGRSRPPTSART